MTGRLAGFQVPFKSPQTEARGPRGSIMVNVSILVQRSNPSSASLGLARGLGQPRGRWHHHTVAPWIHCQWQPGSFKFRRTSNQDLKVGHAGAALIGGLAAQSGPR